MLRLGNGGRVEWVRALQLRHQWLFRIDDCTAARTCMLEKDRVLYIWTFDFFFDTYGGEGGGIQM